MHGTGLRYFLEVVRTGSIAEASARLNVAASAISRQIAKIEAELGVELFERRARGMVPSPAGDLLAKHARRAFLEEEAVVAELQRLRGLATGVVRIAATEGFGLNLVPAAIRRFREAYPGIRFELKIAAPAAVTRMVRDGETDIGATFSFAPEPGVRVAGEGRAPVIAVMAPGHRLAARAALSLNELAGEPLALPEKDTTARQLFDIACGLAGVAIEPVLVSNYIGALWAFAEHGGGITIASAFTIHSVSRGKLVSVPIAAAGIDQRRYAVQTMLGRRLPEAADAFVELLLKLIADSGGERPTS
jgi:DNA-binding transcriptional LysR family regulator